MVDYVTANQLFFVMATPALFTFFMIWKMATAPDNDTGYYFLLASGGAIITGFSPILLDVFGIAKIFS